MTLINSLVKSERYKRKKLFLPYTKISRNILTKLPIVCCGAIFKGPFQVHHKNKSLESFDSFAIVSYRVETDVIFYPRTVSTDM